MERIEKLLAFLKQNPKDSFLEHALALEYIKIDKLTEARRIFKDILKREPSYIGSYYHLGKVLEALGDTGEAIAVYEQGMVEAKKLADMHSYGELKAAHEDLTF